MKFQVSILNDTLFVTFKDRYTCYYNQNANRLPKPYRNKKSLYAKILIKNIKIPENVEVYLRVADPIDKYQYANSSFMIDKKECKDKNHRIFLAPEDFNKYAVFHEIGHCLHLDATQKIKSRKIKKEELEGCENKASLMGFDYYKETVETVKTVKTVKTVPNNHNESFEDFNREWIETTKGCCESNIILQ